MSARAQTTMEKAFAEAGYRSALERLEALADAAVATARSFDDMRDVFLASIAGDAGVLCVCYQQWERPAAHKWLSAAAQRVRNKRSGASMRLDTGPTTPPAAEAQGSSNATSATPRRQPSPEPSPAEREKARGDVARKLSMLDIIRIQGRAIGDCTAEEALAFSDTFSKRARFARMLASNIPPGHPIRHFWKDDEANELWDRVEREGSNE